MSQDVAYLSSFEVAGPLCAARGWAVYPQESLGGLRRPGMSDGRAIQLRSGSLGDLARDGVPEDVVRAWAVENPHHNVACLLGRGSGGVFALDFDVETPERAAVLRDLAFAILGRTPFVRVGNAPRFAMLYRSMVWEGDGRVANLGRRFDVTAGAMPGEALEVLSEGKTITFFGRHHRTGRLFAWEGGSPLALGPDAAPLVDGRLVALYLDEVHRRFPFAVETTAHIDGWSWDEATRSRIPRVRLAAGMAPWRVDEDTGLVVDGREAYLTSLCFRIVMSNPEIVAKAVSGAVDAIEDLQRSAVTAFSQAVQLDAKWPERRVLADVRDKMSRLLRKVADGELAPRAPREEERGRLERTRLPAWQAPPELRFLKPRERRNPAGLRAALVEVPDAARAEERRIVADRDVLAENVAQAVDQEIAAFLDEVYAWRGDPEEDAPARLLKAPTGAGKTSRLLAALMRDPRTHSPPPRPDGSATGPFIVMLPTFGNIQEIIERLARDHALAPGGPTPVLDLGSEEFLPIDLRGADGGVVSVFVYRGKIKAGCRMHEKVAALMRAGRSSSALCRAEIRDGEETREEFCPHYETCPAILQRERAAQAHIVLMPHAFLTLTLPEQLRTPRAVIIDERAHHLMLHDAKLSVETLTLPRTPPRLTAKEREAGTTPEDFLADRDVLARVALAAFDAGECPANAIARQFGLEDGIAMARRAARVCSAGIQRDERVHPGMSLEEIIALCAEPQGFEIREEWRFWRLLEERLQALSSGTARGDRDVRLHRLVETEPNGFERVRIRLAWRSAPNWQGTPLLLLDASGVPEILRKVFSAPAIRVADPLPEPGAFLNIRTVACVDRTFSPSSLLARPGADERERRRAVRGLETVRRIVEAVSLAHGFGRVLVGGPKAVLAALREGWAPPVTVDWAHFGALRGLDAFKDHVAAISVGRMEPPIAAVDAAAAALSHDEKEPEAPFDRRGDGRSPEDPELPLHYPLVSRRVLLRDGSTLAVPVPEHPGIWGGLAQAQIREEEQRQFFGRLRPVYRRGAPPVWYCLSSVVPLGVIVDDVCSSRDLFEERFLHLARMFAEGRGLLFRDNGPRSRSGFLFRQMERELTAEDQERQAPVRPVDDGMVPGVAFALSCLPRDRRSLAILAARARRVEPVSRVVFRGT